MSSSSSGLHLLAESSFAFGATRRGEQPHCLCQKFCGVRGAITPPGPVVPLGRIRNECVWGRRVSEFCFKAKGLWRMGTCDTKGPEKVSLGSQVAKTLPGRGV